jgi:hypothetical protein
LNEAAGSADGDTDRDRCVRESLDAKILLLQDLLFNYSVRLCELLSAGSGYSAGFHTTRKLLEQLNKGKI